MTTETAPKKTALQRAKERAEALGKQAQQAKAKAKRLEAQARAQQAGAERARDTKRKVLLGAYVLAQARAQGWDLSALHIGQQTLADFLIHPEDRALFSLQSLAAVKPHSDQQAD